MSEHPPSRPRPSPLVVLGVVAIGTFMSALGNGLINVAVPIIRRDLHADFGAASWILAAYTLSVSALLLPMGRLGDLWGKRRIYIAGFLVFGLGTSACALAPSLALLIAARALQGAGGAMLMATGPALTTAAFPAAQRGRALGLQATATYLGLTLGPSVGGYLAVALDWHALFLAQLPIALLGALIARMLLPPSARTQSSSFPLLSSLLFALALTALLIALTRAERWGLSSPPVLGFAASGLLLAWAFGRVEKRREQPLLPQGLLRQPALMGGLLASFLHYMTTFMFAFLLPFYLQGPLGLDASAAGTRMTFQPAVMAALTAASGWLSDKVGTRRPAVLGMVLLGIGLWHMSTLDGASTTASLLTALGLVGLGSGLFTSPNNSHVMGLSPRGEQGIVAGLLAEARNLGMLVGVATAGGLFAALGGEANGAPSGLAFFPAFRGTLRVAMGLAALGAIMSLLRPRPPVGPTRLVANPPTG